MILTKKVQVTVSGRNKPYFESIGYKLPYKNDSRGRLGIPKGTKMFVDVFDLPRWSQTKIIYKCDTCGIEREVHAYTIISRKNSQYNKDYTTLCGICANKKMVREGNGQYIHGNVRYPEYRYNAKKRGFEFNLTVKQFEKITNKPCNYCGGFSKERNKKSRGNGIDRKNSNIGYVLENCVPCCATCNFVKNNMPYKDFLKYIRDLFNTTKNYEI